MTAAELLIAEVESATASTLIVTARCITGTVQVGTRLHEASGLEKLVDLTVVELWRYPGRQVDEIDPPHAARVVLTATGTGTGTALIQPGQRLREHEPTAS